MPSFLLGLSAFAFVLMQLGLLFLIRNWRTLPRPPALDPGGAPPAGGAWPRLSVILPVRNEEANLGPCLDRVLAQDYPALEVVVVDDGSTDRTGEILETYRQRDERLKTVRVDELPAGWLGKNHALYRGVAESAGDSLLFLDVDIRLKPGALARAVSHAAASGSGLLTIVPELATTTFWERVVMPVVAELIFTVFPAEAVNDPRSKQASGNGPFMLFRRDAYLAVGGHEAVKGEVVEDLAIARRLKHSGGTLTYILGTDLASLRMYSSFREIWNGFSKNFASPLGGSLLLAGLGALGIVAILVLPWPLALISLAFQTLSPSTNPWFGVLLFGVGHWLTVESVRRFMAAAYRVDASLSALHPLGAAVCAAILVHAAWRAKFRKSVVWKGRAVPA